MAFITEDIQVLVVGTGLVQSLVAGACARMGKQVLMVDRQRYYGGSFASFSSTSELLDFLNTNTNTNTNTNANANTNANVNSHASYRVCRTWGLFTPGTRGYALDLVPKAVYCGGDLVNFMIETDIHHYVEFRHVDRCVFYTPPENNNHGENNNSESPHVQEIPMGKAGVFQSKTLSLLEKRRLQKLLTDAVGEKEKKAENGEDGEEKESEAVPWLKERRISENTTPALWSLLCGALNIHASEIQAWTVGELQSGLRLLASSVGRYGGKTPFLYVMYGSSEFTQAFSRVASVHGGLVILNCTAQPKAGLESPEKAGLENPEKAGLESPEKAGLESPEKAPLENPEKAGLENPKAPLENPENPGRVYEITLGDQSQVIRPRYVCDGFAVPSVPVYVRGVAITNAAPLGEESCVMFYVPHPTMHVYGYQLDHTLKVCPQGERVVHVVACVKDNSDSQIKSAVDLVEGLVEGIKGRLEGMVWVTTGGFADDLGRPDLKLGLETARDICRGWFGKECEDAVFGFFPKRKENADEGNANSASSDEASANMDEGNANSASSDEASANMDQGNANSDKE